MVEASRELERGEGLKKDGRTLDLGLFRDFLIFLIFFDFFIYLFILWAENREKQGGKWDKKGKNETKKGENETKKGEN